MTGYERAYYIADKITVNDDYTEEAVEILINQADEIKRLTRALRDIAGRNWTEGDERGYSGGFQQWAQFRAKVALNEVIQRKK